MPIRSSQEAVSPETADRSLCRAVVARYLKLGLRTPEAAHYDTLFARETRAALNEACSVIGGGELRDLAEGLFTSPTTSGDALETQYNRLFGHSLRGLVCPYETEYGKKELWLQAHELSDLSGFYAAFGLEQSASSTERPDHVAVELEFLELLSTKEAYALESGSEDMFEVTRRAVKTFVGEHLGLFGRAFGLSLAREDPGGFYGRLGELCAGFLGATCGELELTVGPAVMPLSSVEDDDVPMACGSGGELAPESPPFEV